MFETNTINGRITVLVVRQQMKDWLELFKWQY
jgi:hypothetical protein